jgi:hypothetical protein
MPRESVVVLVSTALGCVGLPGCEGGRAEAASALKAPNHHGTKRAHAGSPETRQKAEPAEELITASKKLLAEHADAPIGSEFPISVGGKRYVARIEAHDNPGNEPGRPPGKHKGVTVYKP